jgi:hypothetical protein
MVAKGNALESNFSKNVSRVIGWDALSGLGINVDNDSRGVALRT